MGTNASGSALVSQYMLMLAARQLLIYLGWLLAAALAGAAACWCCGYGAQAAWSKANEARGVWRDARRARRGLPPVLLEEAERGIRDIEAYLETQAASLPRPQGLEPQRLDEEEPG
jgi:hypothetical protein